MVNLKTNQNLRAQDLCISTTNKELELIIKILSSGLGTAPLVKCCPGNHKALSSFPGMTEHRMLLANIQLTGSSCSTRTHLSKQKCLYGEMAGELSEHPVVRGPKFNSQHQDR